MKSPKIKYEAKLSSLCVGLTVIVHLAIFYALYVMFFDRSLLRNGINVGSYENRYIIAGFLLASLLLVFLLRPLGYEISENSIIIKRYIFSIHIPINEVAEIDIKDEKRLKLWLRIFGSGGVWGNFGLFWSGIYGIVRAQLSNTDNVVLFITKTNRKYLISPENSEDFVTAVTQVKNSFA